MTERCIVMAGVPAANNALYHRIRLDLGDPVAYLQWPGVHGRSVRALIVRDIEMGRVRRLAPNIDRLYCPADLAPPGGLDGDRETATAQAVAELLRREQIDAVSADRTLPLIFADHLRRAGIGLRYDCDLGVIERRTKDEREIDHLRAVQRITEQAIEMACRTVAGASAARDGTLHHAGAPLTSERLRRMIALFCMERDCTTLMDSIVATTPHTAQCHHFGAGPLRTGEPVIIDIFPRHNSSRYCGDCTRTVVHGEPSDAIVAMHTAVLDAKRRAIAALRPGVTGHAVHQVTVCVLAEHGYPWGPRPDDADEALVTMPHGTGHGIGLDVHEPILLADGGPEILSGEVFTVEPGLYGVRDGGVRVEDMVVVTDTGPINLNTLPEGLDWR